MNTEQKHKGQVNGHFIESKMSPEAALTTSLMKSNAVKRIADRTPNLKKSAYIALGLIILSVVQTFVAEKVIVSVFGAQDGPGLITFTTVLGWMVAALGSVWLLFTKSVTVAKNILLTFGVVLLYSLIISLVHADIIGLAIGLFLLWWVYNLYESI